MLILLKLVISSNARCLRACADFFAATQSCATYVKIFAAHSFHTVMFITYAKKLRNCGATKKNMHRSYKRF